MGIRIHKAIGYGLTNVIADKENWDLRTDPRFNPEGYLFKEENFNLEGFSKYIDKRIEELVEGDERPFDLQLLKNQIEDGGVEELYRAVIYDMEFGSSNVILFIPPSSVKSWTRYDDMIDYYDPGNRSEDGGIIESVIKIDRPLWPWESWINIKTFPPVQLTGMQNQLFNAVRNLGYENLTKPEQALDEIGVDSVKELKTCIVPLIPNELIEMIKYLKIFVDDKCIYQLRPMIYGYWG